MEGEKIIKNIKNYISLEKAVAIGQREESLNELLQLASTAGVKVIDEIFHRSDSINAAYYIGKGKLKEVEDIIKASRVDMVIFDNELSPAQYRNIEEKISIKVIDRAQLILDIFAQHAHTRESKIQVELAQLEYLLPRLTGLGVELSRLGGGIGTRGPGETKLEIDRRRIQKRIHKLKSELNNIKRNRQIQRKTRNDPLVALVGYTNAGKSTLMNLLTNADTIVADQLFATLDSTLRRLKLPFGKNIIISDTVGFIKKLPHQLVASFSATLEEIKEADILLHVIDSSQYLLEDKINVVNSVLDKLNVLNKNIIYVFNKIDLLDKEKIRDLEIRYPDSVGISALTGYGVDKLIKKISEIIKKDMVPVQLKIPYENGHWVDKVHQHGDVIEEKYLNKEIIITARVSKKFANKLKKYDMYY